MEEKHKKPSVMRWIFFALLIVGLGVFGFAWMMQGNKDRRVSLRDNMYDADIPSSLPAENVTTALILLTPLDLMYTPIVDGFSSPMGSEKGAFIYDAQPFGEDNPQYGGPHLGEDLNGIGGMNTDLGDAVYAAGRGRVLYVGVPSPGWGNVVVLGHWLSDGTYLQSLYAHLDKVNVRYGDKLARGEQLGTVGTAGGRYPAHLHFEMIPSLAQEAGYGGYGKHSNRIDPRFIFAKFPVSEALESMDPYRVMLSLYETQMQTPVEIERKTIIKK